MIRYRLDPTRCSVAVSPRPALVPAPVRAQLIDGLVHVDSSGSTRPNARGTFRVRLTGLPTSAPLLGTTPLPWPHGDIDVDGEIDDIPFVDGEAHLRLRVHTAGRTIPLGATARVALGPNGGPVEVAGRTVVDPRAFGLSLPPLVNLAVHVRWRVVLHPEPDATRPGTAS